MDQVSPKLIGARVQRREDQRLLRGQGRYVDDESPPGRLYAAFLRSPHAHARIVHLDPAAARALPGVTAVVTGAELAQVVKPIRAASRMAHYQETSFPPLAVEKVRYVGEAFAVVVAASRYLADDALEHIGVTYELLLPVTDAEAACAPGATILHDEAARK